MARVSFTVRNNATASGGSFLQYPTGASSGPFPLQADYDSALRADGVQLVPGSDSGFTTSTFSATAVTYSSVMLEWTAPLSLISAVPVPTESILVFSSSGTPQTISSGTVLVEDSISFSHKHSGAGVGRWAYYSLFLHYESTGGDSYYEKVAELEVLIPTDYGSTLRLWEQIPRFERTADSAQGDVATDDTIGRVSLAHFGYTFDDSGHVLVAGDKLGPLFRFLSVLGFDMDRMRTLIDYIMVSRDPELSNGETLNALSAMLNVPLASDTLGETRLRNVLDNVGMFYRSKGTYRSTRNFMNTVANSELYFQPGTYDVSVFSSRANYITVPKTGVGITSWRVADQTEVTAPKSFGYTGYDIYSADVFNTPGDTSWTLSASASGVPSANGIVGAIIQLSSPVPVLYNDFVAFSVQSITNCSCIQWARLTTAGGEVVGFSNYVQYHNGYPYVEIPVGQYINYTKDSAGLPVLDSNGDVVLGTAGTIDGVTYTNVFTNCTIEFMVDLRTDYFLGENYLAEANYVGDYFDGDTVRGGWLGKSADYADYRWRFDADNSISVYAEEYTRTAATVQSLFPTMLPITEANKYTIVEYNGVRGFPLTHISTSLSLEDGSGILLLEDGSELSLYDSTGI